MIQIRLIRPKLNKMRHLYLHERFPVTSQDRTSAGICCDVPAEFSILLTEPGLLVGWAANKDGGAHVDSTLPDEFGDLKSLGAIGSLLRDLLWAQAQEPRGVIVEDIPLLFWLQEVCRFDGLKSPPQSPQATPSGQSRRRLAFRNPPPRSSATNCGMLAVEAQS